MSIQPQKFGRYILLDRIGMGGMAELFRAVMPGVAGFQRTFVVKRILAERARSPYFVDMFVQEARISALLNHPNIVQVFDFGNVGGTYFLAMEYVRGRDVAEILRRLTQRQRPCPIGVAAHIAREMARALAYAHALVGAGGQPLNIVHRDVSPANIMCLRTGGVKLLDFGIAKALGETDTEKTGVGLFKGKISYVAPERIKDQPSDGRSDLFSLGVVLWELLAGQKLFRGKSEFETLKNVLEMNVPPPSSLRPDVPKALDVVVARALTRDPAARYPTGRAMAEDLDQVLETLRFSPQVLPDLLHELFGAELASQALPSAELLALCGSDPGAVLAPTLAAPANGPAPADGPAPAVAEAPPLEDEYSISIQAPVVRPSRWASWLAAGLGTLALVLLLVARGGGGRSEGATLPAPAAKPAAAAVVSPPPVSLSVPVPAPVPAPAPAPGPAPLLPASPRPQPSAAPEESSARHPRRWSGKGRVMRGLSVDPFAEAASRGGR